MSPRAVARPLSLALVSACVCACGVDANPSAASDLTDVTGSDIEVDSTPGVPFAAPVCSTLTPRAPLSPGLWASRQRSVAIVDLPPTNTPTAVATTRLILHDVAATPDGPRLTHTTCQLRQPKLNGVEVVFGPAFLAAVPKNSVVADLADGVSIPPDLVVLGAEVGAAEPLPDSPDDPRVRDTDQDGKPGVSVTLQGLFAGQLYVVFRQAVGLDGDPDPAGCVSGRLVGASEQVQLGASPAELEQIDLSPRPHPDDSLSTFQLVPVDATFDCAALIAAELELFGPEP